MRHKRTALVASIAVALGGLATVHGAGRRGSNPARLLLGIGRAVRRLLPGRPRRLSACERRAFRVSGYAGGAAATADYELVSTGTTGHAESMKVTFDPSVVSFGQILQIFFSVATDPPQLNQQFPDQGPQYRS
jgi:hypothetical protein